MISFILCWQDLGERSSVKFQMKRGQTTLYKTLLGFVY